ncbi:DnaJ-domain-containing protein [Athelia psychrophila]|uniref:DnaJ-domain-containing protein n=1 Tax=Athelia psychrophila TaxID=1759441 RepID=A0A166PZ11_9AGAM|nr:DnaJ-domain-containing protein [Fibularhizoctonia sp. CBS 109695]
MASNYYQVLGIDRSASPEEVKKAYKKKALETHPDKQALTTEAVKESAAARFRDVHDAFQTLSNPYQRRAYDMRTQSRASSSDSESWVRLTEEQVARTKDREEWARQATLARRERMVALEGARKAREATAVKRVQAQIQPQLQNADAEPLVDHETLVTMIFEQLCQMNPEWEARRQEAMRRKARATKAPP